MKNKIINFAPSLLTLLHRKGDLSEDMNEFCRENLILMAKIVKMRVNILTEI